MPAQPARARLARVVRRVGQDHDARALGAAARSASTAPGAGSISPQPNRKKSSNRARPVSRSRCSVAPGAIDVLEQGEAVDPQLVAARGEKAPNPCMNRPSTSSTSTITSGRLRVEPSLVQGAMIWLPGAAVSAV